MKVAGILLLMGVLHGVNLLLLPIIGRLLMLNKQLDQEMRDRERGRDEHRHAEATSTEASRRDTHNT